MHALVKIEGKWKEIPHKNTTLLGKSFAALINLGPQPL